MFNDIEREVRDFIDSFIDENKEKPSYREPFICKPRRFTAEVYLPNGCEALKIESETVIESIYSFRADSLNDLYESFLWLKSNFSINHFIVIYFGELSRRNKLTIEYFQSTESNEGFEICSWNEFRRRRKEGEGTETETETETTSPQEIDEEEKKNNLIKKANELFHEGKNTLFFGAGLGCDIGMPTWDELLNNLIEYLNKKNDNDNYDYNKIKEQCNQSSLIIARYIQELFKDEDEFTTAFKQVLYTPSKKAISKLRQLRIPVDPLNTPSKDVILKLMNISELYKEIVETIKTERVSGVITFNYDDSVEKALNNDEDIKKKFRITPVFDAKHYLIDFPVYHVHGIIPIYDNIEPTYVLSEKDYHKLYKESYDWSNAVQLQALHDTTCFFIGLSLNDPNLRRLLEISKTSTPDENGELHHFAILEKKGISKDEQTNKEYIKTQEKVLNSLGINVIWYKKDQHGEIVNFLKKIRQEKKDIEKEKGKE